MKNKIIFCALILFIFSIPIAMAEEVVSFVEIMPNPDGTDTKTNEYFKLANNSTASIKLENYKVCNISNDCTILKGELPENGCLKIFRTDFVFTLHNDKEELSLFDPNSKLVSQILTDSAPSGEAWLCGKYYCEWGKPREACDYTDIVEPVIAPEEQKETEKKNGNSNSSENTRSAETINKNTNTSPGSKKKKLFSLNSPKDWKIIENEMNRKNLISLTVNLRGIITVPYNIPKANSFYISVGNRIVQINVSTSRQTELQNNLLLFKTGNTVKINNGTLKNNLGAWQLSVNKNTDIKVNKTKYNSKTTKLAVVSGIIFKKSGQYFYISDENKQVSSVFIPSIVWLKFVNKQNLGVFPSLVNGKVINPTNYRNKKITVSGILEKTGNTSRILVIDESLIQLEVPRISNSVASESLQKSVSSKEKKLEQGNLNQNNNSASTPPTETPKTSIINKLSWLNIWNLLSMKFKLGISQLF